ncbi:MAG: hypothetical protein ACYTF7_06345 [Planctomycetota bacterium]|jgi:hypothetical protein
MLLNIIVILGVLFIAYMWTEQGLISAFVHLCCTIAAGAVAFGVWELLVYSFLLDAKTDLAWTLGLMLPFMLCLLAFRLICDKVIEWDIKVDNSVRFVGGGILGLCSGIISIGITVIAVGFMGLGASMFGYQPVTTSNNGSVVKSSGLWLPVDAITAKTFEMLSVGGFSSGDNALARRQPDVHLQAGLVRMTNADYSRTTLSPKDMEIYGSYEVHGSVQELVTDTFQIDGEGVPIRQSVSRFDGSPPASNSKIFGVVMSFQRGAVETTSQYVFGPNQVRLVCELSDGTIEAFYPVAQVSRASSQTTTAGRWRFDGPRVFMAASGQSDRSRMSFEYLIPDDATPLDLLVKNARVPASNIPRMAIEGSPADGFSIDSRDEAVRNMALLVGTPVDEAVGIPMGGLSQDLNTGSSSVNTTSREAISDSGVRITTQLPSGPLHKSRISGFQFGGRDGKAITRGESSFGEGSEGTNASQNLRVTDFVAPDNTKIVQIDVSLRRPASPYAMAMQKALMLHPPILIDTIGNTYSACGYYYYDGLTKKLSFDPASFIGSMEQLPPLSRSRPDDQVVLLFVVPTEALIKEFSIGQQETVLEFDPPLSR